MTYSVIYLDGSPRGKYCGEFTPDEMAMTLPEQNKLNNICYQAAKAIGLEFTGGIATWSHAKARLVEFKMI